MALCALSASAAFERVSERSRPEYLRALQRLEELPTKDGRQVWSRRCKRFRRGQRTRSMRRCRWAAGQAGSGRRNFDRHRAARMGRGAPAVPEGGSAREPLPRRDATFEDDEAGGHTDRSVRAGPGAEGVAANHISGAAALICFEWLQRPENVLAGSITWEDYRGSQHPEHVRNLSSQDGRGSAISRSRRMDGCCIPEIEAYLGGLVRLALIRW